MLVWLLVLLGWKNCVIDRIDGDFAVMEWSDESFSDVPLAALPYGCSEGSRLVHTPSVQTRKPNPTRVDFRPAGPDECRAREKGE